MPHDYIVKRRDLSTFPAYDNRGSLLNSVGDKPYVGSDENGTQGYQVWYENGYIHRENDLPAIIKTTEHQGFYWYSQGEPHRGENKPAIVNTNGIKKWFVCGVQHRVDGFQNTLKPEYILFNMKLNSNQYLNTIRNHEETGCPLWVSMLLNLDILEDSYLVPFLNQHGEWEKLIPSNWLSKMWNLDDDSVVNKMRIFYVGYLTSNFTEEILKVTEFMESESIEKAR